jgi:HEAT repeat protein
MLPTTTRKDTMDVWGTDAGRAARGLMSPSRVERDAAEAAVLGLREAAVPALLALLTTTPVGIEQSAVGRAALLLGALGSRAALPTLQRLVVAGGLRGDDAAFVARAIAELVDGRDAFDDDARAAIEVLAARPEFLVRAFAAVAFGALGDARSKARIAALTRDAEPWVRERATRALVELHDREARARARSVTLDDIRAVVDAAAAEGGALKPWLDDLGDLRRAVRDHAVAMLVRAGPAAVPFLLAKLNQPQARSRIGAAMALGRLQPPEAVAGLLVASTTPALTPEEAELRPVALRALANCLTGVEEGLVSSLLPLSRDADVFVRAASLLCLGRLADRRGLRAVVLAIFEDDAFVVESAAIALSEGMREGDVDLVLPLVKALQQQSAARPAVTEAILIALGRVHLDDAALKVRVRHVVRGLVGGRTASQRKAAIVVLERCFDDDDPPPLPLVDAVLVRVHDEHPDVRVVAASFLARHLPPGFTGAVEVLARGLARGERSLSLLCLEALRRHDTMGGRAVVAACVDVVDETVAAHARRLLAAMTPATTAWEAKPAAAMAGSALPRRVSSTSRVRAVTVTADDTDTTSVTPRFRER